MRGKDDLGDGDGDEGQVHLGDGDDHDGEKCLEEVIKLLLMQHSQPSSRRTSAPGEETVTKGKFQNNCFFSALGTPPLASGELVTPYLIFTVTH